MGTLKFGANRYKIIYGTNAGVEARALKVIYDAVSSYVQYTLTVVSAEDATKEDLYNNNLIFIGTKASNKFIKDMSKTIDIPQNPESFVYKTFPSKYNDEKDIIVIAGADESGVLYGCVDLAAYYIPESELNHIHSTYFDNIFLDKRLPYTEKSSVPAIKMRGLWTWGHVIYDYKKYIENMAKLKMNTIIIWNDFVPINMEDVIKYAHSYGIKVFCGFSWGWDNSLFESNNIDISDKNVVNEIKENILKSYKEDYKELNIDGIYFQTFTETEKETINGVVIADIAVKLVNSVCDELFKEYGDMEILFGLHATSVLNKMKYIAETNKKVHIIWEDCGAFPYAYVPAFVKDFDKTIEFTKQVCSLRGKEEKFGAVLKGLTCLNWDDFEHQQGEFLMGCFSDEYIHDKSIKKKKIWKYVKSFWLENAEYAQKTLNAIAEETNGDTIITALLEDGMFEEKIEFPAALMGEMMWDTTTPVNTLFRKIGLRKDVIL